MAEELRPFLEIQRAHDMLVALITGEVPVGVTDEQKAQFAQWASVLCWVLKHDHQNAFPENLQKIEAAMSELGFELTTKPNG